MRHYGTVCPQFWTGRTGRKIRDMAKASAIGRDVQRVALYLMTSPHANMIGLYFLPTLYLCEEVGIDGPEATLALEELKRLDFSFYDQESEHIWVKEMARFQVGTQLHERDGNVGAIRKLYQNLPANPFLGVFFDRYASDFRITTKREPHRPALDGGASGGALLAPIRIGSDRVGSLSSPNSGSGIRAEDKSAPPPAPEKPATNQDHASPAWIVEEWNEIPGVYPFNGAIDGEMRKRLETRCRERKSREWWREFFSKVRQGDWLCGRNEKGWAATLHWALGPINMGKILAGEYAPRKTPQVNGAPAPHDKPGCNYRPDQPCRLAVTSAIGNERRCIWHSHLARHLELQGSLEEFKGYWPTVHVAIRKDLSITDAWAKTGGELDHTTKESTDAACAM